MQEILIRHEESVQEKIPDTIVEEVNVEEAYRVLQRDKNIIVKYISCNNEELAQYIIDEITKGFLENKFSLTQFVRSKSFRKSLYIYKKSDFFRAQKIKKRMVSSIDEYGRSITDFDMRNVDNGLVESNTDMVDFLATVDKADSLKSKISTEKIRDKEIVQLLLDGFNCQEITELKGVTQGLLSQRVKRIRKKYPTYKKIFDQIFNSATPSEYARRSLTLQKERVQRAIEQIEIEADKNISHINLAAIAMGEYYLGNITETERNIRIKGYGFKLNERVNRKLRFILEQKSGFSISFQILVKNIPK
ncbi:MAG: hypothetical protein HYV41_03650 [Candidatus Magasanikbacteria bacterium]|nr:hypothetical protein [Candidatus Magasanikbacteria bacterium]